MKIYNVKYLLATLALAGVAAFYAYKDLALGKRLDVFLVVIFVLLVFDGVKVSLTREGFEKNRIKTQGNNRLYQKTFGLFAPFAPWVHIAMFILAAISIGAFPTKPWIWISLLSGGTAYAVFLAVALMRNKNK